MTLFGWNLVLALIWCALAGKLTTVDFTVGFVVGYAILGGLAPRPAGRRYVRRVPLVLVFAAFYGAEVVRAAMRVAWDVVTPRSRRRPAILAVPLTAETDAEITLLANLITFAPGSVTLDVTPDRRALIVHDMFVTDPESSKRGIKQRFERWALRIMR